MSDKVENQEREWKGSRVFFWAADAQIRYGTVLDASRLKDGTQVLKIKADDAEEPVSLPVAGVTAVPASKSR